MKVSGITLIQSSRDRVWAFLTDPRQVSGCVPGLESMSVIEEAVRFEAIASVGFGNLKLRFQSEVEWLELRENETAKLKAHGAAPGSMADATAEMHLEDSEDGGTRLTWEADVSISGTVSALASRMMGSVSEKLSNQFFDCVRRKLEA